MPAGANAVENIQGLMSRIREFILHPRRLHPIAQDVPNWNMLASSMDLISDTESAIASYEACDDDDKGMRYLLAFGVLQAMYVQEDSLESLVRALERNNSYKIESEPGVLPIRKARNCAIGHPTKEGDAKPKKDGRLGEQTSYVIEQSSLSARGFTLLAYSNLRDTEFIDCDVQALIKANRALASRILGRTIERLHQIEMEHRQEFKDEKLENIFPSQMSYYFEKIFSWIHSPSESNNAIGRVGLDIISEAFFKFKGALTKRGILNGSSHLRYEIDEAEYPLQELIAYFEHSGFLTDPRAADIFLHFLRDKLRDLVKIAAELDEEYAGDVRKEDKSPASDPPQIRVIISDIHGKELTPGFLPSNPD